MNAPVPLPDSLCFTHEAMNTTFTLRLYGADPAQLAAAAREGFERLDHLEAHLSRFIDTSEISQINHLRAGDTLYLTDDCHQCLLAAMQGYAETGGLFDVTLGTAIEHQKAGLAGPPPAPAGKLIIHPDVAAITCEIPGRELDLGGIGKGFVLDQLRALFTEWDAALGGLLAAGASSLLAYGPQPWPIELPGRDCPIWLTLQDEALSASGTEMQGSHIVHPYSTGETPDYLGQRVWVVAATATDAEIWSTALMLMTPADAAACLPEVPIISRAYAELDGCLRPLKTSPA